MWPDTCCTHGKRCRPYTVAGSCVLQRLQADRQPKDCGVLAIRAEAADGVVTAELTAVHCAASMAFGYSVCGRDGFTKVWCLTPACRTAGCDA